MQAGRGSETIGVLAETTFNHAHPDHPVDIVLERLADSDGVLPIISRENTRRIEGVITFADMARGLGRKRNK
jgi:CBS domain-containing protein